VIDFESLFFPEFFFIADKLAIKSNARRIKTIETLEARNGILLIKIQSC